MNENKNGKSNKMKVFSFISVLIIIACAYFVFGDKDEMRTMFDKYKNTAEIQSYERFLQDASNGMIDTVYYSTVDEYMVYTLVNDDTKNLTREQRDNYQYEDDAYRRTLYPAGEQFRRDMVTLGLNLVLVKQDTTSAIALQLFISLFPALMFVGFMVYLMQTGPMKSLNDMSADKLLQKSNVNLDDIIGLDELKDEIRLIIKLLKDSKYGERLGVKLPKGILLSGAPGTGKTMIAKAISNEAGVNFISVAASDFQELYVGNGARHVRNIFKVAREHTPCVLFIDEIDAIGVARNKRTSTSEDNQTINALLKEMDGFKENENIFVLAATNNPNLIDTAIKRPGRFDREIVIPAPRNWEIRKKLFDNYLKYKPLSDDVDLDTLSRQTSGFTGADIATVCNEAGIVALAYGLDKITHECIEEAIDKRVFKGSRSKVKTYDKDKKVVAKHEAGHALMSHLCGEPIARASIIATTSGVGGAVFHEDSNEQLKTKSYYENRIMICYAGRAAEEVAFGEITTGASNDITQATGLLSEFIGKFGFDSEYGLVDLEVIQNSSTQVTNNFEDRITAISRKLYGKTVKAIKDNISTLNDLSNKLLEVESMTGKQIEEFFKEHEDKEI